MKSNLLDEHKEKQLQMILKYNPAEDDIHTWVRSINDILTFEEALQEEPLDADQKGYSPDYSREMIDKALETGMITVYSSKPIDKGIFVTPSKMEAECYSSNGKVYSKEVALEDVAWIDASQGQYTPVYEAEKKQTKQINFEK